MPKKVDEVVLLDPRLKAMQDFDADAAAYAEAQEKCPECGGYPGYNPITGVELKDGHRAGCRMFAASK